MAARPIIKFYLVHTETGQRYAISDHEAVIGRTSGDILFPDDASLAAAQCRIIPLDHGLSVHDLTASTSVARLADGDRLTVGAQTFTVTEVTRAAPRPPRTRKKLDPAGPADAKFAYAGLVLIVACAVGLVGYALRGRPPGGPPVPTLAQLDREIEAELGIYRQIAQIPEDQIPLRLRRDLIPGLERTQFRLRSVTPASDARQVLVTALLRQTRAMASYYETGDPDVERVLDEATRDLASVRGRAIVGTRRAPRNPDELSTAPSPRK